MQPKLKEKDVQRPRPTTVRAMTAEFGARLRLTSSELACDGTLEVHRWSLDVDAAGVAALARDIGRSYVRPDARLLTPSASVKNKVPTDPNVRKGDFGELVAMGLYGARMGSVVPYSKLLLKPVAGATVQGPDTLAVTIEVGERVAPVIVETKYRTNASPSQVLSDIGKSLGVVDEDYLASAWAAGAELMSAHPDYARQFAFSAAQHLGRLLDPDAPLPPHRSHAVAVVPTDKLTPEKLSEHWSDAPPVTVLNVVEVANLDFLQEQVFNAAAKLTYSDLVAGVPALLPPGMKAGAAGLISRDAPQALSTDARHAPIAGLVEASLWFLADEDGVAKARADAIRSDSAADPDVVGLGQLLAGALGGAVGVLKGRELEHFARTARDVVNLTAHPEELRQAALSLQVDEPLAHAARHVAAALLHRLERHPVTMTAAQGASGPLVAHVVSTMRRFGRHAFWPSQAAAIRGGLFDSGQRSLTIQMPTSAGKTTLMQLLCAHTLDQEPNGVIAVLAPTKSLVRQLSGDLRSALPDDVVDVRSSQGGLDYDTDVPSSADVLSEPGVAVLTPERFDLDWRRAATGDGGVDLDNIKLLVVDEAQHVSNGLRGAKLELVIAKALRRGIRVVLLASQFPDVPAIANWINGIALESDWRPAWLERHVYIRGLPDEKSTTARVGYLWPEGGEPREVLKLKPSEKTKGAGWIRKTKHEAAGLVAKWEHDGLVVVFTENKSYAPDLLKAIQAGLPPWDSAPPALEELARRIEDLHPHEAAALREGLGLHHADVPRTVREVIEVAARLDGGLLRCIVCTPTLLEGVDFPTRTVIAAYPPRTTDRWRRPDIARLRNLEGRAGRAGKFISGRLVVLTSNAEQARKWRRAMREKLPATETALTAALRALALYQPQFLSTEIVEVIDAVTLEALAESAAVSGDVRAAVELALERTFWSATSAPTAREPVTARATAYLGQVAQLVPDPAMRDAIYRSGLRLAGCLKLGTAVSEKQDTLVRILREEPPDPKRLDKVLHWLVARCVEHLDELEELRDIPSVSLRDALDGWMSGLSEADLARHHGIAWACIKPSHLETLLVWALTGAFEIIAALDGDLDLRDLAYDRLGPARIRYGVPDTDLCGLVREGYDRVDVTRVASAYAEEPPIKLLGTLLPVADVVRERLDEEIRVKLEREHQEQRASGKS